MGDIFSFFVVAWSFPPSASEKKKVWPIKCTAAKSCKSSFNGKHLFDKIYYTQSVDEVSMALLLVASLFVLYRIDRSVGPPVRNFGPPISCSFLINILRVNLLFITRQRFGSSFESHNYQHTKWIRGKIGGPKWWTGGPSERTWRHLYSS